MSYQMALMPEHPPTRTCTALEKRVAPQRGKGHGLAVCADPIGGVTEGRDSSRSWSRPQYVYAACFR